MCPIECRNVGDWVQECGILGTGMWGIGYRNVGGLVQECMRSGTGMWEIGTGMWEIMLRNKGD